MVYKRYLKDEEFFDLYNSHCYKFLRTTHEYFITNIGPAEYRGAGSSIKKTATNAQTSGTAYKIYGCGYMMPKSESKNSDTIGEGFSAEGWAAIDGEDPDILVALETVVVLSN